LKQLFGAQRFLGKALVDCQMLTQEQLERALAAQTENKKRLGEAAVALGLLSESALAQFLAQHFHIPYFDLKDDEELNIADVEILPESTARRYQVIIVKKEENVVTLAMADPVDVRALDAVRLETQCKIRKVVSCQSSILKAIDRYYHTVSRLAKSMDHLIATEKGQTTCPISGSSIDEQLKFEATDAPVVQFVNLILMRAVQEQASDIHIEPEERGVTVRFRIDGQLRETSAPPKHMFQAITTRIKLLGNLDIAERRLPQDGRFKFQVFEKNIDVRVSCLPTLFGEKIVMRVLDHASLILDMKSLGFEDTMLDVFRRTLALPHGLVIITGPTGSGKTTTLYAALNSIKSAAKNIVTIEDPVEYQMPKVNQVSTKPDIGLTFAAGLRSILRQDPDIVMVGEIRDRETAEICIRAALTGHLVLSTLHTNESISAVSRLKDMGIEPYLLSATLNLIMAQRLVRKICEECTEKWQPSSEILDRLKKFGAREIENWNFKRGRGCSKCGETGYKGRIAVYEQFVTSEKIKSLIAEGASFTQLEEAARKDGFQTLLQSALNKVKNGITTLDEVLSSCSTQGQNFN
jgi:type IV pilus assembly protein PilB